MTIEKLSSGKATAECRYNPVQGRWACNIRVGKTRIAPQHVRAPEDEAAEAVRVALDRAVKRGLVDVDDLEHEDGAIVVANEGAKRGSVAKTAKAPAGRKREAKAKPEAPAWTAAKAERAPKAKAKMEPSVKAVAKAHKIVGNGAETKALEQEYRAATKRWHTVGEALRERHEAVAAVAAGG